MAGGIEKRRHVRLSAMGPVEVVVQGGAVEEGYLASIGRGGLGIYLHCPLQAAQLLLVNLRLVGPPLVGGETPEAEELKVVARVRWVQPAGRMFMAGASFEKMSDVRFDRLLRHLNLIEAWQLGVRPAAGAPGRSHLSVKD